MKELDERSAAPQEPTRGRLLHIVSDAPGAFPIVGIGASAGGLEAFRRLLSSLPVDTGMAYVLVQHLDPSHGSILAELLSQSTELDVFEVKGDVPVAPNRVYVIPPSKGLILVGGTLKLVPRTPAGSVPMPIDSFLRTLADVRGSQAIGVILSGMGSDGTLGLQAIEAVGGITFVQEPASATSEDMPRSAIRAGCIDFVLPPEGIAQELARLGRHPYLAVGASDRSAGDAAPGAESDEEESLTRILAQLRRASGMDFSGYKKATLRRRIARRMAISRIETLQAYALHLESNVTRAIALYEDCLISVTSFFRDPAVFQALSERVVPVLSKSAISGEPLRIWVAGCATGEEAYSIGMCVLERSPELSRTRSLQIFATDVNERALVKAREGSYPMSIARDVSAERLRRFFSRVGDQYQISKAIREMCVFARHDLTSDPPYLRMDLISCRNLLIYLEPPLQEMLFATFHYALRPEGFLMVGSAETAGTSLALFSAVDEKHRIYTSKPLSGPPRLLSVRRDTHSPGAGARPVAARRTWGVSDVSREADRMLLDRFGPAGVIVDAGLNVLEFRGDTGPFLDHSHGRASLNLEHLLRRGLLMDMRQAIEEARRTDAPVRRQCLQVSYQRQLRNVGVEVIPIKGRAVDDGCLLVLFELDESLAPAERAFSPVPLELGDVKDREIARLGQGLAQTTDYMHMLVREHEWALEELQSTTEEALSGNEELRSLNDELQTAKEEIQSANEELITLNQELQDRNEELARSNDDIQCGLDNANALVDLVAQPLMILDGELRVVKANLAFYRTFETTAERTRDRLLSEIDAGVWSKPALLAALREVLATSTTVEELEVEIEVPNRGVRSMFLEAQHLHPERGSRGRILLAIEDRTEREWSERKGEAVLALVHHARKRAEAADRLKDQFVARVTLELRGPLNIIYDWMNILLAAGHSPDIAVLTKALSSIGRGVAALTRLLSDLIDDSRGLPLRAVLQPAPKSERLPPPSSEEPPSVPSPAVLEQPRNALDTTKLLVVDDEADARDALKSLLEGYGALVRTAASVAETMSALAIELPDVLISDIGMAGEDGYDLIRRVRLLPADRGGRLSCLAVSAHATEEHRKLALSSGFQSYLEKPVVPAELVSEVARLYQSAAATSSERRVRHRDRLRIT